MINNLIVELGHIFLIASLTLSLCQFALPFFKINKNPIFIPIISILGFSCTMISFSALMFSFVVSDFSVDLVAKFSHTSKPLIYKISGLWANHEGSLLLWILILQFFGLITSLIKLPDELHSILNSVQGFLSSLFLSLCIFSSNPFHRSEIIPFDGAGLNPVLQDLSLAIHPPILYVGYVGLSVAFSFAIAALINGKINKQWAIFLRPWIITSWIALTLGITLGSYWAYYELGWGGWWFWDPVENAALMPWLIATALMHSIIVYEKRGELGAWTVLLCIMGFSFSILGTFIVRSGIITSVHSFATDPKRGIIILSILLIVTVLPLTIFAIRSKIFTRDTNINFLSKEMILIINNFILVISSFIILIGTLYPLILEIFTGNQITVGAPYFLTSLSPLMVLTLFFMGIGPILLWKRNHLNEILKTFILPILISIIVFILFFYYLNFPLIAVVGFSLAIWLFLNILFMVYKSTNLDALFNKNKNFKFLTNYQLAVCIAHLGVAVFSIGAVSENFFNKEIIVRIKPGEKIYIGRNLLIFENVVQKLGSNYISEIAKLVYKNKNGDVISNLYPEKRMFPVERQTTTEVAIYRKLFGDIYAVMGDGNIDKGYTFRVYSKPFVSWIWIGATLMAIGGIFSVISSFHKLPFRKSKLQ